jgi:phosphonate transport system ATP-binding protein
MIEVEGLRKSFRALPVLKGVSFRVGRGEALFILGPSGAGKSTLLRCLNGLVRPDAGRVVIDGVAVDRKGLHRIRKQVGFIFQGFNIVGNLSVLQNVLIGRLAEKASWNIVFTQADRAVALDAIAAVGLRDKAHARADTLSGGQKQRVGIARALAHDPSVLLADEPISNLDPRAGNEVLTLLKSINQERGTTLICNLHDVGHATRLGDRILGLRDGLLQFDGPAAALSAADVSRIYGEQSPALSLVEVTP